MPTKCRPSARRLKQNANALVALGVRHRGVELASAGSRAGWEAAQAAQVTPISSRKTTMRMPSQFWQRSQSRRLWGGPSGPVPTYSQGFSDAWHRLLENQNWSLGKQSCGPVPSVPRLFHAAGQAELVPFQSCSQCSQCSWLLNIWIDRALRPIGISAGNPEHWELKESIGPRLGTDWEQELGTLGTSPSQATFRYRHSSRSP